MRNSRQNFDQIWRLNFWTYSESGRLVSIEPTWSYGLGWCADLIYFPSLCPWRPALGMPGSWCGRLSWVASWHLNLWFWIRSVLETLLSCTRSEHLSSWLLLLGWARESQNSTYCRPSRSYFNWQPTEQWAHSRRLSDIATTGASPESLKSVQN